MNLVALPLAGSFRLEASVFSDHRGTFARTFCARELSEAGLMGAIAQINHSRTTDRGTVRGMHYQTPPHAEAKIIRCLRGAAYDVIVDIRRASPTFLQWHAENLAPERFVALYVPEGFAHGFQTLEPDTEMLYLHSTFYQPGFEGGLRHDDPALGISWPLPVSGLSERDRAHPLVADGFQGVQP